MSVIKIAYATSTAITITATTLASGSMRESLAIDNSSNLYDDILISIRATLAAGSPTANGAIYAYAAASEDGTNYTDNATGADAALTLRTPTNLQPIGACTTPTSGALTYEKIFSLAQFFGGTIPRKWSLIIDNESGLAFTAFAASYTGVTYTST